MVVRRRDGSGKASRRADGFRAMHSHPEVWIMKRLFPLAALSISVLLCVAAAPSPRISTRPVWAKFFIPYFSVRSVMATPAPSYSAKIEQTQYRKWNVYKLTNGLVALFVAPQLGGRAIQLQLGDQEYFFVNKALEG